MEQYVTPAFTPRADGAARVRFELAPGSVGAVFVDNVYLAWDPVCEALDGEDGAVWQKCEGGGGPPRQSGFGRWNAKGEKVFD